MAEFTIKNSFLLLTAIHRHRNRHLHLVTLRISTPELTMFRDTTRFVLVGYLTMFTVAFEAVPSTPLAPRNSYRKRSSGIQPNSSWIGDTADQPTFHHGMTATFGGEEYILHQVHATAFWGIRPEDWDDSIRVMNNTDWSLDEVNTSLVAREIDDRDLVTGLCHAYESCISYAQSGIVTIGDVAPQYFESLRAVANSVVTGGVNGIKSVNQILNDQPFICQVVASKSSVDFAH